MKKLSLLSIILLAAFCLTNCGKDSDENNEKENQVVTYVENPYLGKTTRVNVNKSEMPEWLVKEIDKWEANLKTVEIPLVFRGEWKGETTVYYYYAAYYDCIFCTVFYADGTPFDWKVYDSQDSAYFPQDTRNWQCIYVPEGYPDELLHLTQQGGK